MSLLMVCVYTTVADQQLREFRESITQPEKDGQPTYK